MLSPEARKKKAEYDRRYWLRKAKKYGIDTVNREDDAIREARSRYMNEYWERKARED